MLIKICSSVSTPLGNAKEKFTQPMKLAVKQSVPFPLEMLHLLVSGTLLDREYPAFQFISEDPLPAMVKVPLSIF